MSDSIGSMIFVYAETPLHAGSGTGLGAVDLPIQRERMSNLPMVQGSGLKGAFREELTEWVEALPAPEPPHTESREEYDRWLGALPEKGRKQIERKMKWRQDVLALFGNEASDPQIDAREAGEQGRSGANGPGAAKEFAGAVSFTDLRLLLFPLRTVQGGWAWATSPMVIERVTRDTEMLSGLLPDFAGLDVEPGNVLVTSESKVVNNKRAVVIEDFEYPLPDRWLVSEENSKRDRMDKLAQWLQHALPARPKEQTDQTTDGSPGGQAGALVVTPGYAPFMKRLNKQLILVSDEDFRYLTEQATEVSTRIRMDPRTGTVRRGALWTEESLPAETMLWAVGLFSKARLGWGASKEASGTECDSNPTAERMRDLFHAFLQEMACTRIRLGGDRSTGRGIAGLRCWKGGTPR